MTGSPVVTVGLPVFNGERYLAEAIESILAQDLPDLELIVADNCSTDSTPDICRSFAAEDDRVRILWADANRGATWNYNRIPAEARGQYFKWQAHDDLCAPELLRSCVEVLAADRTVSVAYARTILIGAGGELLDDAFDDGLDLREDDVTARLTRYLSHQGEQHAVFGVFRTAEIVRSRMIGNCWGGDIVLLTELLLRGRFHEVPERLFLRRYHPASSMVANASFSDVAAWFDPRKRGRAAMPRTRLLAEILRVVATSELPPPTRARLMAVVVQEWLPRYWRHMGGEAKLAVRTRLQAVRPGG